MESLFHGLIWEPERSELGMELWLWLEDWLTRASMASGGALDTSVLPLSWPPSGSLIFSPGRIPRTDISPGPQQGSSLTSKHVWMVWLSEPVAPLWGDFADWIFLHPVHLSWLPAESTYLVLLQDPHPRAPSNTKKKQVRALIWVRMLCLFFRLLWGWPTEVLLPAAERGVKSQKDHVWVLTLPPPSYVTLDRYSTCFELQFPHLYNGDDYCCFICHSTIT